MSENSLWRSKSFILYWTARSSSIFGSAITQVVLPILVFRLTGSALQTSLLVTLQLVPYMLLGLFAGAVADRFNRKRIMVTCDLVSFIAIGSIPLAAMFGFLTMGHIYVATVISACAFVWFDAASLGALPAIVGKDRIISANSTMWSTQTAINVGGPAIGGILAATLGPAMALGIDSFSYVLSAALIFFISGAFRTEAHHKLHDSEESIARRTSADIKEGLVWLWSHRLVRALTLLGFGASVTGGAVTSLLVVYGVQQLDVPEADARIGILYSGAALGALAASLSLPYISKILSPERITLVALLVNPPLLVGVAVATAYWIALLLLFVWHAAYTIIVVNAVSVRMKVTPDHLQSRVNTTARMISWGGTPLGAAIGGVLAEATSISTAYLIMILGVATSAAVGWFSPLRKNILKDPDSTVQT